MSTIPGLERPAPVPNDLTRPFWDACNQRRLVLQNCTVCERLHYPPTQRCDQCGSADNFEWKEVEGKGHIDVYMVIRDSRIRGFRSAQPINFAVITWMKTRASTSSLTCRARLLGKFRWALRWSLYLRKPAPASWSTNGR